MQDLAKLFSNKIQGNISNFSRIRNNIMEDDDIISRVPNLHGIDIPTGEPLQDPVVKVHLLGDMRAQL